MKWEQAGGLWSTLQVFSIPRTSQNTQKVTLLRYCKVLDTFPEYIRPTVALTGTKSYLLKWAIYKKISLTWCCNSLWSLSIYNLYPAVSLSVSYMLYLGLFKVIWSLLLYCVTKYYLFTLANLHILLQHTMNILVF